MSEGASPMVVEAAQVAADLIAFIRELQKAGMHPSLINAALATALVRALADDPNGAEAVRNLALVLPDMYDMLAGLEAGRKP